MRHPSVSTCDGVRAAAEAPAICATRQMSMVPSSPLAMGISVTSGSTGIDLGTRTCNRGTAHGNRSELSHARARCLQCTASRVGQHATGWSMCPLAASHAEPVPTWSTQPVGAAGGQQRGSVAGMRTVRTPFSKRAVMPVSSAFSGSCTESLGQGQGLVLDLLCIAVRFAVIWISLTTR